MGNAPDIDYAYQESALLFVRTGEVSEGIAALIPVVRGEQRALIHLPDMPEPTPMHAGIALNEVQTLINTLDHLLQRYEDFVALCYQGLSTDMSRTEKIIFKVGHECEQHVAHMRQELQGVKDHLQEIA